MAGVKASFTTAEIALSAATLMTIVKVVPASNHPAKLKSWSVAFDGTSSTAEPVVCSLQFLAAAGTFSSLTGVQTAGPSVTVQAAGGHTCTSEPAKGGLIDRQNVHPQSSYSYTFPFGEEPDLTGNGVGIVCTAPAGVNVIGCLRIEE